MRGILEFWLPKIKEALLLGESYDDARSGTKVSYLTEAGAYPQHSNTTKIFLIIFKLTSLFFPQIQISIFIREATQNVLGVVIYITDVKTLASEGS